VLYRTGGERDAPVQLLFTPWRGRDAVSLGAGWDPTTAFVRGRVLVAGVTLVGADGAEFQALVAASTPGRPLRPLAAPAAATAALAQAVDFDMAATDDGAVLAWIEAAGAADGGPRALRVARVTCR